MIESVLFDFIDQFRDPSLTKGLMQAGAGAVLALIVIGLARIRRLALEKEFIIAILRGFVQIVVMGSIVGLLLHVDLIWSVFILLFMMGGASIISKSRGKGLPGVFQVSFFAIVFGSGIVIITMTLAGAIEANVRNLVPIGSLIIAQSMQINSLALNRLKSEIRENRSQIEVGLSLGAPPRAVISRYIETGVHASLIPVVDSLKSLGWVWIPGIMAGMILAGENPVYAGFYQFVIMMMVFGAGGLTSMTSSLLIGKYIFTDADQLKQV